MGNHRLYPEDRDGTRRILPNRQGTLPGGVISPLRANLYLNPLDWAVNERCAGKPILVWYAARMPLSS